MLLTIMPLSRPGRFETTHPHLIMVNEEGVLLRAKSNKKVLLTKSNKNDRNQQVNNNNLITQVIIHQYQQKDTLIQPSPS